MLMRLLAARGTSGNEGEVRSIIREAAAPLADEITVDRLGSLIATKKGTDPAAPAVMLCAHMDEVGFLIDSATDEGLLRYQTIGGIDPIVLASGRVLIGEKKVPGVIGSKAIHLQSPDERTNPHTHKTLFIDIGAKDKADALKMVSPGDHATFDSEIVEFGAGMIKSRALDDRVGCYALLRILEKRYPCTVICAFTVQEEVGCRGAQAAAHRVQPDMAIIVEGTTAGDTGDARPHEEVCRLGDGPAVSFMDMASIAHRPLMLAIREAAAKAGIPWQVKRFVSGGNDSGAVQRAGAGVKTCVVSVPCRYIHSPVSVCSKDDIENTVGLLDAFLSTGAAI